LGLVWSRCSSSARFTLRINRPQRRQRSPRREARAARGLDPMQPFVLRNFVPEADEFIDLVDHPRVFPKVWGVLGYNVYLYHAHLAVTPPLPAGTPQQRKHFHQDSARVNRELSGNPRPRLSLKVGYFLDGVAEPDNGNLYLVPGSHRHNDLVHPPGADDPPGALAVCVQPGTAVMFDRRLWHSTSPNLGRGTRKALFCGYAYRWIRTKDAMTVSHLYSRLDPIRRQLLGDGVDANGYFQPTDEDTPLRPWLERHDPAALEVEP
jgi:ectoine hydroxylase-related dioxygenase (phytanoyl-CoA dioxygenase family)